MSMSFEVFPTRNVIPKCEDVINYSTRLFVDFLRRENISEEANITITNNSLNNDTDTYLDTIISNENNVMLVNLNGVGEVLVTYNIITEIDKEFWEEEIENNKRAQSLKNKINTSIKIGHSWSVKRTMSQPAIVSLYYGFLAIAIANITSGIIYSDDGAWDYSSFPIESSSFEKEYLYLDKINDAKVKDNVNKWIETLEGK